MDELSLPLPQEHLNKINLPPASTQDDFSLPAPSSSPSSGGCRVVYSPQKRSRHFSTDNSFERRARGPQNKSSKSRSLVDVHGGIHTPQPTLTFESVMDGLEEDAQEYGPYVEYVLAGAAGFYQIESDLFVVQGWDGRRGATKVRLI